MDRFNQIKNRFSLLALLACYSMMVYAGFYFYPKWTKGGSEATISWDVSGYYMYLPAIFIYNDLKECKFQYNIREKYSPTPRFEQARKYNSSSGRIMQYNCGQALAMSPFFLLAHGYTLISHSHPSDGFSFPYQAFLGIGMFLYALVGVFLLRKILLNYFSDKITGIALLFLIICTPLLNYLSIDQTQANPLLFSLYCLVIYMTMKFYASPSIRKTMLLGFLCGFVTLIRPTDVICILIPFLWGVNSLNDFKSRFTFWSAKTNWILLGLLCFIILPSIQFFYWKYVINDWFAYSYADQGFSWLKPHVVEFFLSYKSGFLTYCPAMILSYLGLYYFMRFGCERMSVVLLILISHYLITAWDIIDYGWYSGRAMIQYFPLLAFPLGSLIENMMIKKTTRILFGILFSLSLYFNGWWTYHIHAGNTPAMNLTKTQYWNNIGRWR